MIEPLSNNENNRLSHRNTITLIILAFGIFVSLTAAIYWATRQSTPGTDFFIYYNAARNITQRGLSPYNDNVGEESQLAILKRFSLENEDQLRFVYPPYALIPVLPLANLPFPLAQSIWMSIGLLALCGSFIVAFPKSPRWFFATLLLLYPIFFGFLLGNFDILIVSLLFIMLAKIPCLSDQYKWGQILAGFLLAWITIKPQFVWFYLIFLGLFTFQRKLKLLAFSFFASLAGLTLVSFAIVPNWITEWIAMIQKYPSYTGNKFVFTPLLSAFISINYLPAIYGLLFTIMCVLLFYLVQKYLKKQVTAFGLLTFGGFFTYLFHPTGVAYEQLTFLIPIMIWIVYLAKTHSKTALAVWVGLIASSWGFFILGRFSGITIAATGGLFTLFVIWMITGFLLPPKFVNKMNILN